MTRDTTFWLAAAASTATAAAGAERWARLTKPLPLAILAATSPGRRATASAAALGDVLMHGEEFHSPGPLGDRYLRYGATAFAAYQLGMLRLLHARGSTVSATRFAPRSALMSTVGLALARRSPALLPVLGPYGMLLSAMASAAGHPAAGPRARLAGWLFLSSDLTLMQRRIFLADADPRLRAALKVYILGSYFAAQKLLFDAV